MISISVITTVVFLLFCTLHLFLSLSFSALAGLNDRFGKGYTTQTRKVMSRLSFVKYLLMYEMHSVIWALLVVNEINLAVKGKKTHTLSGYLTILVIFT